MKPCTESSLYKLIIISGPMSSVVKFWAKYDMLYWYMPMGFVFLGLIMFVTTWMFQNGCFLCRCTGFGNKNNGKKKCLFARASVLVFVNLVWCI